MTQCRHCIHPEHTGQCNRRNGGTAYRCGCFHDAERPTSPLQLIGEAQHHLGQAEWLLQHPQNDEKAVERIERAREALKRLVAALPLEGMR